LGWLVATAGFGQVRLQSALQTYRYQTAFVHFQNGQLTVGTGSLTRRWVWTGRGLATRSLAQTTRRTDWCRSTAQQLADWSLPGVATLPKGTLTGVTARESNDEGFTSRHLEVVAEVHYPTLDLTLRYVIWAFPGMAGLRTQLLVRSTQPSSAPKRPGKGIPTNELRVVSASREGSPGDKPANVLDDNPATVWKTTVSPTPPEQPTVLVLALSQAQTITGLTITQPQDYLRVGYVHRCLVYATSDTLNWGVPVGAGELSRAEYPQWVPVLPRQARYVKLVIPATNQLNYPNWQTVVADVHLYSEQYPRLTDPLPQGDFLPLSLSGRTRRGIGYYGDTQFRNSLSLPFYREEVRRTSVTTETWDWNNLLSVEDAHGGVVLVKESHKTVLHQGHQTGSFQCTAEGIAVTGWGLAPHEFTNEFRSCWANWCLAYTGGETERQWVVKAFDRARFPASLPGHRDIVACSWGFATESEAKGRIKMNGAFERNVRPALVACRDMGIETYLIDAGWAEDSLTSSTSRPPAFRPNPSTYPHGWSTLRHDSDSLGVRLALWAPVTIPPEDLVWNQKAGKFSVWKLDYANLTTYEGRATVEKKARDFIRKFDFQLGINWDLTEIYPRYGFYWAREYGVIWLENREPSRHILYTPSVTLRDAWELAKYGNLNKFQLPIRNVRTVLKPSDAFLHNQDYAVAVGMVGIPMFFEKVTDYTPAERQSIRRLLEQYKAERDAWLASYLFPVGDQPSNASITGFQAIHPNGKTGHLLLFRELYATESSKEIKLHQLSNKRLKLTDLRTGTVFYRQTDRLGQFTISINQPADFSFYRYELLH